MNVSQNFDVREFIPKSIFDKFGDKSTWFVNPKVVRIAEFYKTFWLTYYKNKLGNEKVKSVAIVVNNWHSAGPHQWRGLRTPECTEGADNSQHRYMNAFDCDIIVLMADGTRLEADYKEVHAVIQLHEVEFMANGVSAVEDVAIASTWLHTDCRYIPDQKHILVVKP